MRLKHSTSIPSIDYPTVFTWCQKTISLADVAYQSYLEVLLQSFFSIMEVHSPALLKSLTSLSPESQQLILEAPETYFRLNAIIRKQRHPEFLTDFIRSSISVENIRAGGTAIDGIRKWSANGDFFADDAAAADEYSSDGWKISGKYFANRIATVPIDYMSPYARAEMPVAAFRTVKYGSPKPFKSEEAAVAESKITDAFAAIQFAAPQAGKFIARYVKSVVLRTNVDDPDVFQSASRNAYVGQVVLLNPQGPQVDIAYMAESLVHEAIHSLMWRQEILSHFLIDPNKDMGIVTSPWSGEKIFYYTLLQAVFVWYGIAWFWHRVKSSSIIPHTRAEILFNRAVCGFRGGELLKCVKIHESNLHDGIITEFRRMIETISKLTFHSQ